MNEDVIDRFTLAHVVAGYALAEWGVSWEGTLLLSLVWEGLEPILKEMRPELFPHPSPDSSVNKAADVAATMIGWSLKR